jgi:hypothetical protein
MSVLPLNEFSSLANVKCKFAFYSQGSTHGVQGKEILFIADSENLGATVDLSILRILTYLKYMN